MPSPQNSAEPLGIIAGNRSLPLELATCARKQGVQRIVAVAFEGETEIALETLVDEIVWVKVGQLSKMINAFTKRGVKRCVMVGQLAPTNLYEVRPDLRAMSLLFRLKEKNAHTIFGAVAEELKKDGVELVEATPWLRPLMPGPEFRLGPKPTAEQSDDIRFGYQMAKEVSRLEIGQTVVVKGGTVLAVEGFEGTDKCLERGGGLAGKEGKAVAVKVAKPDHDMRFDIPCIGPSTLKVCINAGISVLAFEAARSILLEQDACGELAAQHKLCVTTVA